MTGQAVERIDASTVATMGGWASEDVAVLREQIAPDTTDAELAHFARVCKATGLDPFRGQIYAIVRNDSRAPRGKRMTIQVGIDGLRRTSARTGLYQGTASEQWCASDLVWRDVWLDDEPPAAARVGVYRKGAREPIYAVATFRSYAQRTRDGRLVGLWASMPAEMLAKCAEAKALRRAFPDEAGDLYLDDELSGAASIDSRIRSDTPGHAPDVRVTVEPELPESSAEQELTNVAREQAGQLTKDERAQLRIICAELGVQPRADSLVKLLGEDVRDLRAFIAKQQPASASQAPEPAATAAAAPPPPGPDNPSTSSGAAAHTVRPLDLAGAAIAALTPDERGQLAQLAYDLGWAPAGSRISVQLVLDCIGRDATVPAQLRAAIKGLQAMYAEQQGLGLQAAEPIAVEPEQVTAVEQPSSRPGAEAGDFQSWLDRGHPAPTPEGPQEERLL